MVQKQKDKLGRGHVNAPIIKNQTMKPVMVSAAE
jgi:hypothetical protein